MFEDFDRKNLKKDQRRFWISVAGSSVLYISLAASLVAASAAARTVVKEEEAIEIEFTPPEAEPPPPAPPPPVATPTPPSPRPKTQRQELEMPTEVPDEKPAESDKELSDAPPSEAGKDGFTNGTPGGTGTAAVVAPPAPPAPVVEKPKPDGPVQLPENGTPAVAAAGNAMPEYPEEARKAGISSEVIAKFVIRANGTVDGIVILRGDPIFHAAVKAALSSWHFEPAKLPDGTPISVYKMMKFPFRLENM